MSARPGTPVRHDRQRPLTWRRVAAAAPALVVVVVVVVVLALDGPARGQEAPSADELEGLAPTARELSDLALRQYQGGELDAAIESFMGAFALSDNTGLLFNIAQAYRLKGDCVLAKEYYERYLTATPRSNLKSSVERRVVEMDSCAKAGHAADPPARPAPPVPPAAPAPRAGTPAPLAESLSAPVVPAPSSRRLTATWMLRGSAVALLASSAVFGVMAWDAKRDFDDTSLQRPAREANDRFALDTTLALTHLATGLACAAASYLVARHR